MTPASLTDIVAYTDELLRIREVADERNAVNGLQVENGGTVSIGLSDGKLSFDFAERPAP